MDNTNGLNTMLPVITEINVSNHAYDQYLISTSNDRYPGFVALSLWWEMGHYIMLKRVIITE